MDTCRLLEFIFCKRLSHALHFNRVSHGYITFRGPTFRFVNVIEYITVGYFDEIKKQRIKEHSNEIRGSNLLVYPTVTRKLRHVTTTERGFVNICAF